MSIFVFLGNKLEGEYYEQHCSMPPPNLFMFRHVNSLQETNNLSVLTRCLVSDHSEQEMSQNCALVGYYTASNGNFLPTWRDNLSGPILRIPALDV